MIFTCKKHHKASSLVVTLHATFLSKLIWAAKTYFLYRATFDKASHLFFSLSWNRITCQLHHFYSEGRQRLGCCRLYFDKLVHSLCVFVSLCPNQISDIWTPWSLEFPAFCKRFVFAALGLDGCRTCVTVVPCNNRLSKTKAGNEPTQSVGRSRSVGKTIFTQALLARDKITRVRSRPRALSVWVSVFANA